MNIKKLCSLSLAASTLLYGAESIKLDDIVTIGTKTQKSVKELPMQVSIIDEEQIQNSGASSVGEILNSQGDIYLNNFSGNGATMSIRGMAHADTLILIDGKRVNGEFSKTYELDRIPSSMIERIEIVKGSASLLYGSDAMGGVINIITKQPKEVFAGDIQFIHGKNKNGADINLMGSVDKTSYKLYSSYLKRDAFSDTEFTDVKVMQAGAEKSPSTLPMAGNWGVLRNNLDDTYAVDRTYKAEMDLKSFGGSLAHKLSDELRIRADFSYLQEDKESTAISTIYEANYLMAGNNIKVKYLPVEQYDENERKTYSFGVDYNPSQKLSLKYDLSYSQYDKQRKVYTTLWNELGYTSYEDSLSGFNSSTIKHINNDISGSYIYSSNSKITAGGEYRKTDVESSAYNVDDRTYKGAFIQHEYSPLPKLNFVYGARYDKDSIGEDETSLSLGGSYKITEDTVIKANYSEGFRSPDDRELYVDQTSPSGKKMLGATVIDALSGKTDTWDLKPETSQTYEVGLSTKGEIWNLDLSLFKTDIEDRISRISTANYNTFRNVSDSRIEGFETSLSVVPAESLLVKANYSRINGENKTDNTKITYSPEELAGLSLSYFLDSGVELRATTKYTGEQVDDTFQKIKAFTLTNFKVVYSDAVENMDIFAGIDNIFGENVPDELGAVEKVDYYIGLKYKF
jgi:outer membrane receptor for ferrienterochelin and colicins